MIQSLRENVSGIRTYMVRVEGKYTDHYIGAFYSPE